MGLDRRFRPELLQKIRLAPNPVDKPWTEREKIEHVAQEFELMISEVNLLRPNYPLSISARWIPKEYVPVIPVFPWASNHGRLWRDWRLGMGCTPISVYIRKYLSQLRIPWNQSG